MSPGERLEPIRFGPVSRTDIVRYAGASGDFNPIHHDEPFALAAGLPSVMAHGMLSAGFLASFVTARAGAVRRFAVRFREPVWPGDVLTAAGEIVAADTVAGTAELELSLANQNGAPVVTGRATVAIAQDGQVRKARSSTANESN